VALVSVRPQSVVHLRRRVAQNKKDPHRDRDSDDRISQRKSERDSKRSEDDT